MIPVVGIPFDLASAAISFCRGNHVDGLISLAAVFVDGATVGKLLGKAGKAGGALPFVAKEADKVDDLAKWGTRAWKAGGDKVDDACKGLRKCEAGTTMCFVPDAQVARDLTTKQTAAWLDRTSAWAIGVGVIAVGLCVGVRKKKEDEADENEAARQLFRQLGEDDSDDFDDSNDELDLTASEPSTEAIDSLCEQLFHGKETLDPSVTTPRHVRKVSKIGSVPLCTLDRPRQTKTIKHVSRPEPVMKTKSRSKPSRLRQIIALSFVLLGSLFGCYGFFAPAPTSTTECVTSDIGDIKRFEWILSENPEGTLEGENVEAIDWRKWRFIDAQFTKPNGTVSQVNLSKPVTWLEEHQVEVGKPLYLEMPELGIVGYADVVKITPAPDPGPRPSSRHGLVTATFAHTASEVIDLHIEDTAPIGCTPNHPFWSVDRKDYIEADELNIGERVLLATGDTKRVLQKLSRSGNSHAVCNIEVYGEHVYHVGTSGVLVHNACNANKQKYWTSSQNFEGNKVFQRNDLINPRLVDSRGRTNLQRMKKGLAPISSDGKEINLHHMTQRKNGAIAEVTENFHKKHSKILHINPSTIPSGIDRKAFRVWKRKYWMARAKDFGG